MKEKTRDKILKAALNIVSQKGILGLSITSLSKESKISKSLICYHFKTMEEIMHEIFLIGGRMGQEHTVLRLSKAKTPLEKIIAIVEGAYDWAKANPKHMSFFILMYNEANQNKQLFDIHRSILQTGLDRIKLILFDAELNHSKDRINSLALAIHSLLIGSLIRTASLKDQKEYLQSQKSVVDAIKILMA